MSTRDGARESISWPTEVFGDLMMMMIMTMTKMFLLVAVVATCFWCLLYYALVLAGFTTVVFRSFKSLVVAHTQLTVDGRNPKQPPGMYKNPENTGINYQPQLVQDYSHQQFLQWSEASYWGYDRQTSVVDVSESSPRKVIVCIGWFPYAAAPPTTTNQKMSENES